MKTIKISQKVCTIETNDENSISRLAFESLVNDVMNGCDVAGFSLVSVLKEADYQDEYTKPLADFLAGDTGRLDDVLDGLRKTVVRELESHLLVNCEVDVA